MDFSKFASKANSSTNQTNKGIPHADFEMLMEIASVELGDFNMGRTLNSFYWSAVGGVFGSIQDQFGEHAPSYLASKARQEAESMKIVHWLHSNKFVPKEGEGSSVKEICDFFIADNPITFEIEMALVIEDHMRELKKHNRLLSSKMDTPRLVKEFQAIKDEDVKSEYSEIAQGNVDVKLANQNLALAKTIKCLRWIPSMDVGIEAISEQKLYYITVKLAEKLVGWIKDDELKKKKEARLRNSSMVRLLSANLELMDSFQERINKLIAKADEFDELTNTTEEITTAFEHADASINEMTDAEADKKLRDREYNGGINI